MGKSKSRKMKVHRGGAWYDAFTSWGNKAKDSATSVMNSTENALGSAANSVTSGVTNATSSLTSGVTNATSSLSSGVTNATNAVSSGASNISNSVVTNQPNSSNQTLMPGEPVVVGGRSKKMVKRGGSSLANNAGPAGYLNVAKPTYWLGPTAKSVGGKRTRKTKKRKQHSRSRRKH
jgi:hypothetical protein